VKGLQSVVLCLILAVGLAAARPAIYNMGAVHRFTPTAGDEVNSISFANGITIDTRTGEPALPAGLKLNAPAGQSEYYIVQFNGPLLRQWFSELDRAGIKTFGYLPHYAVLALLSPDQRAYVASLPMVHWVGLFQPAYKLESGLLGLGHDRNSPGVSDRVPSRTKVVIMVMPGADPAPVKAEIAALGGTVNDVQTSSFGITITATLAGTDIASLAQLPQTCWMQEWSAPTLCNNSSQWVMQEGWRSSEPPDTSMAARPVWRHGVRGQHIILSTTDTGVNTGHNMFRDPNLPITPPGIWPTHRKIVAYKLYEGADPGENEYHGSHVACTVCGNDSVNGDSSYYDGMAKDARFYFTDISDASGNLVGGTDITPLWDTVYLGRGLPDSLRPIKQHSGSWGWGNFTGNYLLQDASTDAYCWVHKDFMNILAAGNYGQYGTRTISNPALAKDVLTIGATGRGTQAESLADFSSRGPSQDGRIKPNVDAPGIDINSMLNTGTNDYTTMSGTSMATPAANGTVGLMRCYLQEGYYPTGSPVPANRITYISSALLRSMAIASADPNINSITIPSTDAGWGRIDAESVLYFTGDTRKLIIIDDTFGIATGEYETRQFHVATAMPLRICLAWTDTAAAPNANPTLVNDLDLTVTSHGGIVYKGNKYTSGQSTPNPTGRDSVNTEECVRVNAPDTGVWTIRVSAHNVKTARNQSFAWTITGDVAAAAWTHDVGATAIIAPTDTVDTGAVVTPKAVVSNFGTSQETFLTRLTIGTSYTDTMTKTLAAGISETLAFKNWVANPAGTYAVKCSTGLATDQDPSNDVAATSVVVSSSFGIEEGHGVPAMFGLDRVVPNPTIGRTSIRYGLPKSATVDLSVYTTAGTLVRRIVAGNQNPGWYDAAWDGNDLHGRKASAGVYLLRFKAGTFMTTRKLVVQR